VTDNAITFEGLRFGGIGSSVTSTLITAIWDVLAPLADLSAAVSVVVAPVADQSEFSEEMTYIASLEDGWAGEDSIAPSKAALRNVQRVSRVFSERFPIGTATANDTGTISLEWTTSEGYCHLEIGNSRYAFTLSMSNGFRVFQSGDMKALNVNLADYIAGELFPRSRQTAAVSAT
jgi:hypothetical protein